MKLKHRGTFVAGVLLAMGVSSSAVALSPIELPDPTPVALPELIEGAASEAAGLTLTSKSDFLGTGTRLVFSTVNELARPAVVLTLRNTSAAPIPITNITITNQVGHTNFFRLAAGQATSFTIAPGATATVSVTYNPTVTGASNGRLMLVGPGVEVPLNGYNARDFEGSNEPRLHEILRVLGYSTNVGGTTIPLSTSPLPIGDEVLSPYFKRLNPAQPVSVMPIARYVQRFPGTFSNTGWNSATGLKTFMFQMAACPDPVADPFCGENQKLLPVPTGTTNVSNSGTFGLWFSGNFSDDQLNLDTVTGLPLHNWRIYPALVGAARTPIPGAYIAGVDVKLDPSKNWDYNDVVYLIRNAQPAAPPPPAPSPGPATTLNFSSVVAATRVDKDGQGTGFPSVQNNTTGGFHQAPLLDLDTTAGVLRIKSTAGSTTGAKNSQVNAMAMAFNSTVGRFTVSARIKGNLSDLASGSQQKAIWFGPDQDNYLKLEIENVNGVKSITLLYEAAGGPQLLARQAVPNPGTQTWVDLYLTGNPTTKTVQAAFRYSGTDPTAPTLFGPAQVVASNWFTAYSQAGVLVSHTGSTTQITGVFDNFAVTPAP